LQERQIFDESGSEILNRIGRVLDAGRDLLPLDLIEIVDPRRCQSADGGRHFPEGIINLRGVRIKPLIEFLHRLGQSREKLRFPALGHIADALPDFPPLLFEFSRFLRGVIVNTGRTLR
jgi:hypothetical protein